MKILSKMVIVLLVLFLEVVLLELLFPGHARLILRLESKVEPPKPAGLGLLRHWKDGPHAFVFYGKA